MYLLKKMMDLLHKCITISGHLNYSIISTSWYVLSSFSKVFQLNFVDVNSRRLIVRTKITQICMLLIAKKLI